MEPRDTTWHRNLREVLERAGFTDSNVLARLRARDFPSLRGGDVPILLHRTGGGSALDTLIRLFLVEVPCDLDALRDAIRPMDIQDLSGAGLITIEGSSARPAVKLLPYKGLFIAFDLPSRLLGDDRQDYVMGIGSSTLTLASLTIRKPSRLTLDLGTGCGFHSLLAARHSDRVIATDINERAVRFTRFNAMTNGIEHIECRTGDLFTPVQGHAFDLIVTNPPFVISPERAYIYRDSGMNADDLCRTIVREAPRYLADGGFCHILCNWAEYAGSDWKAGLESWFAGTGCDAWVMRSECRDIATYASTWIRHTEKDEAVNYPERFGEWLRYYDHLGISHIGAGVITMRRRSASRNWYRADEAPNSMLGPCGDGIAKGFLLQDFLDDATDRDLLGARLTLSPDARLERSCSPSPQGWMETALKLRLARGLAYSGDIDPFMAGVLTLCSGQRTLGEVLQDLAAALGSSPDSIQGAFIGIIRALVGQGFLLPEGCRFE